jgi:hypothetical protein
MALAVRPSRRGFCVWVGMGGVIDLLVELGNGENGAGAVRFRGLFLW